MTTVVFSAILNPVSRVSVFAKDTFISESVERKLKGNGKET